MLLTQGHNGDTMSLTFSFSLKTSTRNNLKNSPTLLTTIDQHNVFESSNAISYNNFFLVFAFKDGIIKIIEVCLIELNCIVL